MSIGNFVSVFNYIPFLFLSLKQFGELASCCHDILANLCSYDKIYSLLSSSSMTHVWEQSVLTAIHQLRERFPTYPDLVQPLTASLTVVSD